MVNDWTVWLQQASGVSGDILGNVFTSLLILFMLWLIHQGLLRLVQRRVEDSRVLYTWRKAIGYIIFALAIFFGAQIWLGGFRNIATYLGLITAGLTIALRDLIVNFVGWVFILGSRPFGVGDRIQIGAVAGDVIDLGVFQFSLLEIGNWVDAEQSTGRIIHVPNGKVFTDIVANYETGFRYIWNEIPLAVTLDSNWQKAKETLQEIANRHAGALSEDAGEKVKQASRRFMIYYANLTPTVYTSLKDKGVVLTIRYLCEPRLRRTTAQAILEDALHALQGCEDIHLVHIP